MRFLLGAVVALAATSSCGPSSNTPPSIANAPGGTSPSIEQAVARGDAAAAAVIASVAEIPTGQSSFTLTPTNIAIPDQTAIFKALGFEVSGNDIVVDWEKPSGIALGKLGLLLRLASYPDILKSPGSAAYYAVFLDADECRTYFSEAGRFFNRDGLDCNSYYMDWKGNTQFEKQDSHEAFVAAWESKLRKMIPAFPFTVLEKRQAYVGPYRDASQELALAMQSDLAGDGGIWRNGIDATFGNHATDKAGLSTPLPQANIGVLIMPPAEARDLMEGIVATGAKQFDSGAVGAYVGTRYLATGTRSTANGGAILDLLVYNSQALYADKSLATRMRDLPLGATALTVEPAATSAEPAYFDNMLPRILAAKLRPALLDDDAFLRETLKLRAAAEGLAIAAQRGRPQATFSNWPVMAPAALREFERLTYAPEDLARTRAWLADAAKRIGNTTRVKYVCGNEHSATKCESPGQEVSNGRMFSPAADLKRSRTASVPKHLPENRPASQGFIAYDAGDDIKVIYSQSASPHWFGVDVPFDWKNVQHVSMDLTIVSASFVPVADGEVLLVDLAPRSFTYMEIGGVQKTFDLSTIPLPATAQPGATGGYFDIAGIAVGMPLAEAETKAAAALPSDFKKEAREKKSQFGLTHAIRWYDPTRKSREAIEVYYDPDDPQRRLTGVGRVMPIQTGTDAKANQEEAYAAMMARLDEKYGTSDTEHKMGRQSYWASDPVQKARFATERSRDIRQTDNPCLLNNLTWVGETSMGQGKHMFKDGKPSSCGEMLSVSVERTGMLYMLVLETTLFNQQKQRQMNADKPKMQLNDAPL